MSGRRVALSYRRDDSEALTGRLFDRLAEHFGRAAVFRDIESISAGTDFRREVEEALTSCAVVVAVIGRAWRGPMRGGQARIDQEVDPVRIELEIALRRDIPVIPVLVGPTRMPAPSQLPPSLEGLAFRHACRVDPGVDFDHHADRLIREIERVGSLGEPAPAPPPRPVVLAGRSQPAGSGRDRAPDHMGAYARSSLSHYPGRYIVVRPGFQVAGNLYAYLADIAWDEEGGGLVFQERSRTDTRHTQSGEIWIPSPSNYLYLVSGRDGWLRSITLSLLDDRNRMGGLISTLHNVRGAHYAPIAAPIVFVKLDDAAEPALGELTPDHPDHAGYLEALRRATGEGAARLILPPT